MVCPDCTGLLRDTDLKCPSCGVATAVGGAATGFFAPPVPESDRTGVFAPEGWSVAIPAAPVEHGNGSLKSLRPGSILAGRYEILKTLGEGGMGAVYQAHDTEVERIVAIKVIRQELASSADILRRFRQELVLARQITHRNVVRIFDIGVSENGRFISMEFIEGRELAEILEQEGRLQPKDAAEIVLQVCEGLAAAHAQGVIHRDLKPQNIMVDKQGRAAVMDFGIAHSTDMASLKADKTFVSATQAVHLTQLGAILGTPQYMSPEQARGEHVDPRSDLFTVGLIFYEITTGELPPMGRTLKAILRDRGSKQISAPIEINPEIPRQLNRIIYRCLQLDPSKRYQTAHDLARDLEIFLGLRKRIQASWQVVAGIVASVVVAAAGLVYMMRPQKAVAHAPVKVLISDFDNNTGNPVLTGALEPQLGTLLEGASFITAYNRGQARRTLASQTGDSKSGGSSLDEKAARLVAQREGVDIVVSGAIAGRGSGYALTARALDSRTNKIIDEEKASVSAPREINQAVARVATGLRKALGDTTPKSAQLAAAETFSSESLEASQQYSLGQELQSKGKWDDALDAYKKSTQLDPNLGRAFAGMAVIYANTGRKTAAENSFRTAMSKIDRMTDREKYRTRGAYYLLERDYDKAIEQFQALEKQYPSDSAGIANLALAYFYERNMTAAQTEGRRAVAIYPDNLLQLNNLSLYAMYAGDFDSAIRESQKQIALNPSFEKAWICMAIAQLAQGNPAAALATYRKVSGVSGWGASDGAVGLADLALVEGRADQALAVLEKGIAGDTAAHDTARASAKVLMTAEAWMAKQQTAKAVAAADQASKGSTDEALLYPAAMIYLQAGNPDRAMDLSRILGQRISSDAAADAKLIEAEVLLKQDQFRDAIRAFQEAQKIADTWLGRFGLGRAYLAAGAFTEADGEFDVCMKRRGEATAVFLDDEPSWRYFGPVNYYLGRAREGLMSPSAADAYKAFLDLRGKDAKDPLVADARHRLAHLSKAAAK